MASANKVNVQLPVGSRLRAVCTVTIAVAIVCALVQGTAARRCRRPTIPNVTFRPSSRFFRPGQNLEIICTRGEFFPRNRKIRQCQLNGLWDIEGGSCIETCPSPPVVPHSQRHGDCCSQGSVLNYTCSPGLEMTGQGEIRCVERPGGYVWSAPFPSCNVVSTCDDPGEVDGATRQVLKTDQTVDPFVPGDRLAYTCNDGYFLDFTTDDTLTCTSTGEWDYYPPYCMVVAENPCPPVTVTHGAVRPVKAVYYAGDVVEVTCDPNYTITGDPEPQCMGTDFSWDWLEQPSCTLLRCPPVSWPQNGRVNQNGDRRIGTTLQFVCDTGFRRIGPEFRTCEETGKWSGVTVRCDSGETTCPNPGTPVSSTKVGNSYDTGAVIRYTCANGMYLQGSAERTCLPNGLWSGDEPSCQGEGQTDKPEEVGAALSVSFDKIALIGNVEDDADAVARSINVGRVGGVDLYFLLDVSGSITEANFNLSKEFAIALLNKTGVSRRSSGTRIAFLTFHRTVTVNIPMTRNLNSFADAVREITRIAYPTSEGRPTSITAALEEVRTNLMPTIYNLRKRRGQLKEPQKVLMILTDGMYNERGSPVGSGEKLKKDDNAQIYCVGVGQNIDSDTLRSLASDLPGEQHFFKLHKIGELDGVIRRMISPENNYEQCGISDSHGLNEQAVERDASEGAWPWMAKIKYQNEDVSCGGSLVNKHWILTAAHCFDPDERDPSDPHITEPGRFKIILGQTTKQTIGFLEKDISSIHIHSGYDSSVEPKYNDDIALLKLTNEVTFSPTIRPICLTDSDFPDIQDVDWFRPREQYKGVVTGWGRLPGTSQNSENLRQKQMGLRTPLECITSLRNFNKSTSAYNNETMFCAGDEDQQGSAVDANKGDSGGPFAVYQMMNTTNAEQRFFQTGIVSWGHKDREVGLYGFYTKLTDSAIAWIRTTIAGN
ncbi:hypothetical protein ScPMuIL_009824 [Solemya velum]